MIGYLLLVFVLCNIQVHALSNSSLENVTENTLWFGLVQNCQKTTGSCVKNTIYNYLKETLDSSDDVQFNSFIRFSKNAIDFQYAPDNITDDVDEEETPLEEMSRSLSDNTKRFFMTHDLEIQLPEAFFLGNTLKVSPRSSDGSGSLVKLELLPKESKGALGQGRIFFKKIRKFISDRLLFALLAVLLVIKLLAVKVLFILPSLVGVVTAKKLIVKVLLFLFPALHHFFKLCAVTPYGAKHHIHKHQIAHIHQVSPGHYQHKPHHAEGPPGHYFAHKEDSRHPADSHASGTYDNEVYQDPGEENEDDPWGLGFTSPRPKPEEPKRPPTQTEIENMILKAEKEALIKSRLQKERERIHEENLRLQEQLNSALKIQQKLKHHAAMANHKLTPSKYMHHHRHHMPPPISAPLSPLVPPPLPSGPQQIGEPPKYFGEPTLYYGDRPPSDELDLTPPQATNPGAMSGPFAEPPSNYVETQQQTIEELPSGVIGGGLPEETVDAVQSYINQKTKQNVPTYHVYQQPQQESENYPSSHSSKNFVAPTHAENFVTPQHVTVESVQSGLSIIPALPHQVPSHKVVANRKSDVLKQEDEYYKAAEITYDQFYSPILQKIDAVLNQLGFVEEPCRERLICSMYKDPERFSPHSNLISSELSRDSKELQKPTSPNVVVVRFYKYVQAARDGQDQRDCTRLYPSCSIDTEA